MPDITVSELNQRLQSGEELLVIDVREPHEYEEFNIGAKLIPLGTLASRLSELPDELDTEIVVHCRSGARSATAQQFLQRQGYSQVRNMIGGVLQWQKEIK